MAAVMPAGGPSGVPSGAINEIGAPERAVTATAPAGPLREEHHSQHPHCGDKNQHDHHECRHRSSSQIFVGLWRDSGCHANRHNAEPTPTMSSRRPRRRIHAIDRLLAKTCCSSAPPADLAAMLRGGKKGRDVVVRAADAGCGPGPDGEQRNEIGKRGEFRTHRERFEAALVYKLGGSRSSGDLVEAHRYLPCQQHRQHLMLTGAQASPGRGEVGHGTPTVVTVVVTTARLSTTSSTLR